MTDPFHHLGSSNVLTDRNGELVKHYEYTAFGKDRSPTQPCSFNVSHRYTGQIFDEATGLYYYGARYYDPELARFIQADSEVGNPGDPQTLNRYSYALNNPLVYIDPSGNFAFLAPLLGALVGGLISGTISAAQGGSFGRGFLSGAVGGFLTGFGIAAGGAYAQAAGLTGMAQHVATGIGGAIGGAAGGAASAGIEGGNVGLGALIGGISGAIFGALDPPAAKGESFEGGARAATEDGVITLDTVHVYGSAPAIALGPEAATIISIDVSLILRIGVPIDNAFERYHEWAKANNDAMRQNHPRFAEFMDNMEWASQYQMGGGYGGMLRTARGVKAIDVLSRGRTVDEALTVAEKWVGSGYKEIAPGVFRSADGTRQFRMTTRDLLPTHGRIGPHVHFERIDPKTGQVIKNIHTPIN